MGTGWKRIGSTFPNATAKDRIERNDEEEN